MVRTRASGNRPAAMRDLLTLACLLRLTACDSPAVVSPQVAVTVLSHVDTVQLVPSTSGGSHTVRCGVTYELLPTSKPVQWKDVIFQFHFGADRSHVDEQIYVPADTSTGVGGPSPEAAQPWSAATGNSAHPSRSR